MEECAKFFLGHIAGFTDITDLFPISISFSFMAGSPFNKESAVTAIMTEVHMKSKARNV